MKNLKIPLIIIFIYIALVFNIEKLPLGGYITTEVHRFVDVLILAIIISSLLFSGPRKLPIYANLSLWLIVYFGFWFFSSKSTILEINLAVTLIEVLFIVVAVLLARDIGIKLFEVESALDRMVFASFRGRTLSMMEAAEEIKTELLRSRRYQRSLTVLVLEPDPTTIKQSMIATVEEIQHNLARRYAMGKISEVINATARRPAIVIKHEQSDRFILLSPETTADGSSILSQRIQNAIMADLGVSVSVGSATFPDDALTFEELVHKASAKIEKLQDVQVPPPVTNEIVSKHP